MCQIIVKQITKKTYVYKQTMCIDNCTTTCINLYFSITGRKNMILK